MSSVFGPYAQDDAYGSRAINPMELYHNQVTRVQGAFSLRMFHRSWGLMLIQSNLEAPCALLDFPSLDQFIEELDRAPYDIVGISAIRPNLRKVARMCEEVRRRLPDATIVVGGHIANEPSLRSRIDADHIVRGEGVRWFRQFLGEDVDRPIRHPEITSGFGGRTLGVPLGEGHRSTAATLIPSVGCPMGCNFCSTSAMFGGKGRSVSFFESGDELYDIMCRLEASMRVQSFFVMDENFLLYRKRALRLLERMRRGGKPWSLYVFSSAHTLRRYTMEELVGLGISWLWMGLEGKRSGYAKLGGIDTRALVTGLQENGIRVLGSTIVGLPEHTPEGIDEAIEHAVAHDTEFHQFMLYTPLPGTPLHLEHQAAGTLLSEEQCDPADVHGQLRFNFKHPWIRDGQETEFLLRAFRRDFEANGPSVTRIARTLLRGWRRHKHHAEERVRARFARECAGLSTVFSGAAWAAERHFRHDTLLRGRIRGLREELAQEFGWRSRASAAVLGPAIFGALSLEERRLRRGWTYEPATFYEVNAAAKALPDPRWRKADACRWVSLEGDAADHLGLAGTPPGVPVAV